MHFLQQLVHLTAVSISHFLSSALRIKAPYADHDAIATQSTSEYSQML